MMPSLRQVVSLMAGVLLLAVVPARGTVVGTSSLNADGSYTYSYDVNNMSGSFDISLWSLEFDFLTPDWNQLDVLAGGDVGVPSADWFASAGIPVSGLSAQDFLSFSPLSDVLVGTSLSGFSFTSRFAPGTVSFAEFDAAGLSSNGGTTVGPSRGSVAPVPEGVGPYELIAGMMLAAMVVAERRQKNRANALLA